MPKNSILITGGAGFIGINTALYFSKKGWSVTILDNFSRKGTELNLSVIKSECPEIIVKIGDVRFDKDLLQEMVESHDVVIHLAAQVAVTTSVTNPREDFDINAGGTFNILEAVRLSNKKPIVIYSSTNKVYGGLDGLSVQEERQRYNFKDGLTGVKEDTLLDFHSPYGCSKGAADQYVRDYSRIYGLKTIVFRQSCIYGPFQYGIEDQGWVAWFLIAGLLGKPTKIYGNGKQVRDLLFVTDLVQAYLSAIENINKTSGQVYNLGGGFSNSLSLLEFLDLLNSEYNININYSFDGQRPGDQPIYISDNSKAAMKFGWEPTTSVKDGLRLIIEWLRDNEQKIKKFYI